jgi:hypothetical protein
MFEIIKYDHPGSHLYEYVIKADFSIPVRIYSPVNHLEASAVTFKSEHFDFNYKMAIAYDIACDFNVSSMIGRQLRGQFIGHFGSQKSEDALTAGLKYMASAMNDDGFTCGLIYGQVLSDVINAAEMKAYYDHKDMLDKAKSQVFALQTGGLITSGSKFVPVGFTSTHRQTDFSSRAIDFSRKDIFLQEVKHPVAGYTYPLRKVIMSLNDHHGWTREQIADWLETLDININMQPKEEANV